MRKSEKVACSRTGEIHCKCLGKKVSMSHSKFDLKSTMRKLFTDHAYYDVIAIKSIVDASGDDKFIGDRLKENARDLGEQLKPLIGDENGDIFIDLFTQHVEAAGDATKAMVIGDRDFEEEKVDALFANGDEIAKFLSSLNPQKLPENMMIEMFRSHNMHMGEITNARMAKQFAEEIVHIDAFYNEMLEMSDTIVSAL